MQMAQKQVLAPRMIQSMEILQLPIIALQERIEQEMEDNPVLDQIEPTGEEDAYDAEAVHPDAPADTERELVALLKEEFHQAVLKRDTEFAEVVRKVAAFVDSPGLAFDLPLDIRGTVFQRRVWEELRNIPPGETCTYTEVANAVGKPKAVRAVASACAANRLAVAIPCHRVKRNDGSQGGYRWGLERKKLLQEIERESEGAS